MTPEALPLRRYFAVADHAKYPRLLAADVGPPLSDEQILERFGSLFEEADRAWRADPEYLTVLGEAAGQAATAPGAAERRERQRLSENRQQARQERREAVIRLWHSGLPNTQIAARLGEPVGAVAYILQTAGLRREKAEQRDGQVVTGRKPRRGIAERDERIADLLRQGLTQREIAKAVGCSNTAISDRLKVLRGVDTL